MVYEWMYEYKKPIWSPVFELVLNSEDSPVKYFLGILFGESHNFNVISEFDSWLDSSVHSLTIDFSFKYVLVWAELEPLWVPWIIFLDNIPVDHTGSEVAHHESFMVVHQVHFSSNIHEEECIWIPHPELVLVALDVVLEIALKSWEEFEIWRSQTLIILACEDEVLST